MFNISMTFKKTIVYLVVLSVVLPPLSFLEIPVRTYAAETSAEKETAVYHSVEPVSAGSDIRENSALQDIKTGTAAESAVRRTDDLENPAVKAVRKIAEEAVVEKRAEKDKAWDALMASRKAEAEEKAKKSQSSSSSSSGKSENSGSSSKKSSGNSSDKVDLGKFLLTAYCPCYECSLGWGRRTSSGATARSSHTIAVDPSVIPYGTRVMINGETYVAEDEGSGVSGKHIDIFFDDHSETLDFGTRYAEVYELR